MKKGFVFALVLTVFVVNIGFAASADLEGSWTGTGTAVVPFNPFNSAPVPTFLPNILLCGDIIEQDGSLLYGVFVFGIPDPDENELDIEVEAFVTGNITKDKRIQAIISNPSFLPTLPIGTGIIDGKWSGKTITGVARDFTDGSTTYFEVKRGECPINGD